MSTSDAVKRQGKDNDLIERIKKESFFEPIWAELDELLDAKTFIGRAPQQVEKFTGSGGEVMKALEKYSAQMASGQKVELSV